MNDLEQEIHEAFDAVVMPQGLKEKTMMTVRNRRSGESQSANVIPVTPSSRRDGSSRSSSRSRFRNFGLALAACLALVAVGIGGFKLYTTETAYIGIDINPSIELSINCFDRVVSQRAVNDDGELALADISLVGKTYDEAMATLSESEPFMASLSSNGYVEISVTSDNTKQTEKLSQESDRYIASWPCEGSCHSVSSGDRAAAVEAGMGVNRYKAALQLMELDPSVTLDECRSLSMRVLRDRIVAAGGTVDDNHGHDHGATDSSSQGSGSGMGNGQGGGQGQGSGSGMGDGQGNGSGNGQGNGSGNRMGDGQGMGSGNGQGNSQSVGANNGQESGQGMGAGQGTNGCNGQGSGGGGGNQYGRTSD